MIKPDRELLQNHNQQRDSVLNVFKLAKLNFGFHEFGFSKFCGFRMACPGEGLPPELVSDMFHSSRWTSPEGLSLSVCRKILKLMNGEVQYIRESERSYFLIILELPCSSFINS